MQKRLIQAKVVNPLLDGKNIEYPAYATNGSAAMDLRACLAEPITLQPMERLAVPTGLAINMMDPGLVAIVASRSGLSLKHGIRVAQGIGVIDSDYHGEIKVLLTNDSQQAYEIQPGERIGQLMFQQVSQVDLHLVDEFTTKTDRGTGGFGSTGKL